MYFLKSISSLLFLIILVNSFTEASSSEKDMLKRVVDKTQELKHEVENALKNFKENCTSKLSVDGEKNYEKLVSDFLKENFTNHRDLHVVRKHFPTHIDKKHETVNETAITSTQSNKSFMTKVKHKLSSLIHHNKTDAHPEARLKRCLTTKLFDSNITGAQIVVEEERFNLTASDVEEFEKFLQNFIKCLKNEVNDGEKSSGEITTSTTVLNTSTTVLSTLVATTGKKD
jgi:hypothetical protein